MFLKRLAGAARLLILALIIAAIAFQMGRWTRRGRAGRTVMIRDTLTVFEPLPPDTVLRWRQKIRWIEAKPETIREFPRDSGEVVAMPLEAILAIDYKHPRLAFRTAPLDPTGDHPYREYVYPRAGSEFYVRAKAGGWFVRRGRQLFRRKALNGGLSVQDGAFLQAAVAVARFDLSAEISAKGTDPQGDLRISYRILGN